MISLFRPLLLRKPLLWASFVPEYLHNSARTRGNTEVAPMQRRIKCTARREKRNYAAGCVPYGREVVYYYRSHIYISPGARDFRHVCILVNGKNCKTNYYASYYNC